MRRFGLVLFVLLTPSALFAWGKDGHQIVALVAQAKIQPATAAAVKVLLGSQTLADIAPLPDVWRAAEKPASNPKTVLWHFTDIPTTESTYVPDRDCPKIAGNEVDRNCVIAAIDHFQVVLADTHAPAAARVRALTFVVHFVGDVHQPLHTTSRFTNHNSDRGGNGVKASFPGGSDPKENLHHVWDDDLIASEHRTQQVYVQHLLNDILPTLPPASLAEKSDVAWANSAHQLAVADAYKYPGTSLTFAPIDAAYVTKNTPVADDQLTLAGIHLAHVLDAALGPAPAGAGAAVPPPPPAFPHPDHVVVVLMENKSYGDVIGSTNAPYLNSLPARGALLTAYCGLHHPSQPNYVELFSGKEQGVCNDNCPPPPITAPNLAASLLAAHKTFVGYAENLPANLTTCSAGNYARKHCPWLDFTGIPTASLSRDFTAFPTTAAAFASLPNIAFVIPNLLDDMHSAATSGGNPVAKEVAQGDTWLRAHLDAYATWAVTHNSLLVITWDEDSSHYTMPSSCANGINTSPPANHIPTLIVGAHVVPGSTSSTAYTHYHLLRTLEDFYGLAPIGGSAGVPPISGIWAP